MARTASRLLTEGHSPSAPSGPLEAAERRTERRMIGGLIVLQLALAGLALALWCL